MLSGFAMSIRWVRVVYVDGLILVLFFGYERGEYPYSIIHFFRLDSLG